MTNTLPAPTPAQIAAIREAIRLHITGLPMGRDPTTDANAWPAIRERLQQLDKHHEYAWRMAAAGTDVHHWEEDDVHWWLLNAPLLTHCRVALESVGVEWPAGGG